MHHSGASPFPACHSRSRYECYLRCSLAIIALLSYGRQNPCSKLHCEPPPYPIIAPAPHPLAHRLKQIHGSLLPHVLHMDCKQCTEGAGDLFVDLEEAAYCCPLPR